MFIKLQDHEFNYLADYLKNNYGINLKNKRVLLEGRLSSYLSQRGFTNYTSYIRTLMADRTGREIDNLLNRVTTNHTYFLREPDHFDYFRTNVLPLLEKSVKDKDLRIWCAACSTGEEAYTLAMVLQDYFGSRFPSWDKRLLATDLSVKVLEQAMQGIYPAESIQDLPDTWQRKYFAATPNKPDFVQVAPEIRREVTYRQFNLMDAIRYKKPFHVVFCRNVMIYFDSQTKAQLVERIYDSMCPGGFLFVGHTESLTRPTRFNYIMPSVYQKGV